MLNNKYIPKWKMELELEKKKIKKEITQEITEKVTEKVTQEITKEVIKSETIKTIQFMRNEGISEISIRKFAEEKNISDTIVNEILNTTENV